MTYSLILSPHFVYPLFHPCRRCYCPYYAIYHCAEGHLSGCDWACVRYGAVSTPSEWKCTSHSFSCSLSALIRWAYDPLRLYSFYLYYSLHFGAYHNFSQRDPVHILKWQYWLGITHYNFSNKILYSTNYFRLHNSVKFVSLILLQIFNKSSHFRNIDMLEIQLFQFYTIHPYFCFVSLKSVGPRGA